jgi:FkbH-like protein
LSLRLVDEFGDNGIIAVVIAVPSESKGSLEIDTWLMSCRVLGRQIEQATLNILADRAVKSGAKTLVGKYVPTTKNGMVADHYKSRGFSLLEKAADGASTWMLDLSQFTPLTHAIEEIK